MQYITKPPDSIVVSVPAGSLIDGIYVNVSVDVVAPKRLHKELLGVIRRISVDICLGL